MPFVSMRGFHESQESSFIPRKVGVSIAGCVLSPSFISRPVSSLHWSEDPSHLSSSVPCSQLPGFCKQKMWCIQMHSTQRDHLHVGCWRHVGEAQSWCCWCTGERVSVRWLLPVGFLLAFSRFCLNVHPVLFWLICRVRSIGSICTFFQKRSFTSDFVKSFCQVDPPTPTETTFLFSLKAFSIS